MANAQVARIVALLAAEQSPPRRQLLTLTFDALLQQPVATFIDLPLLRSALHRALAHEQALRGAELHLLPALERAAAALTDRSERVRDLLSPEAERLLGEIVQGDQSPRFGWLRGALALEDVRQLVAPIVQQLLLQFASKLPIPGFAGSAASAGAALSGLIGMLGKQVQRGAGQFADVGRSMLSGAVRDFSQSAVSEFQSALTARLASAEGAQIVQRMRERLLTHVLATELREVAHDLMRLPRRELARLGALSVDHQRAQPLFELLLEGELRALTERVGESSVQELLAELELTELARSAWLRALEPALRSLVLAEPFAHWLDQLLEAADRPAQILVATSNPNKVRELAHILGPLGFSVQGLHELALPEPLPEPVEDADSFEGNARIKARAYAAALGMSCVAEDSGLEVDALGGAPGVYSARYAGIGATREERDRANNEKLLRELAQLGPVDRRARFVCALCLVDARGQILFETRGSYEGVIAESARGSNGFGYDPLLLLPELGRTSAELTPEEKSARSHRGAAARALAQYLTRSIPG